ncbi:MAG: glycosyltransferase [Candidatus Micrarchaeota archaeon]|nr:glycosyltransferase [Candidatus Micrarchaeota archaeon]
MASYNDTTVIIPIKDEPAVADVARRTARALPGCRIMVIYKHTGKDVKITGIPNLEVIRQVGSGKGTACVQAAKHVKTDIMCFIDGDGTYDPVDLRKVISLVRDGADMALGDRMTNIDKKVMPLYIRLGNHVLTMTSNILYGLNIMDSQTGARAIRTKAFRSLDLKETHFGIETEMNVKFGKSGYNIAETPIRYYVRVGETKQMKLIDGVKLLLTSFKFVGKK